MIIMKIINHENHVVLCVLYREEKLGNVNETMHRSLKKLLMLKKISKSYKNFISILSISKYH